MDANIAVTQFTSAGIAVWVIQVLKQSKWWPLLKESSDTYIKRLYSIVVAIGVHTGISAVWNKDTTPGYHQLIFTIPPLAVIAVTLWHCVGQFVMQEGWFQVAFNRVSLTSTPQGPTMPVKVTEKGQIVVPVSEDKKDN